MAEKTGEPKLTKMGVSRKASTICPECGHHIDFRLYQAFNRDTLMPIGELEVRDMPLICPTCKKDASLKIPKA